MHTIMIIAGGLALLTICLLVGRTLGSTARGAVVFLPLWFIGAVLNMWVGVSQAGYPWSAELPIFLIVFGVPAGLALLARHRFG